MTAMPRDQNAHDPMIGQTSSRPPAARRFAQSTTHGQPSDSLLSVNLRGTAWHGRPSSGTCEGPLG